MKNKRIFIICIMCIMFIIAFGTMIYAYFTTYSTANGSMMIYYNVPELYMENIDGIINISNIGDSKEIYVIVKVLAPEGMVINKANNEDWEWKDDYLYYKKIMNIDDIIQIPEMNVTSENFNGKTYKLIYYAEAINAKYDEEGNVYSDWNAKYRSKFERKWENYIIKRLFIRWTMGRNY